MKSFLLCSAAVVLQSLVGFSKDTPTAPTKYVTGIEANIANKNKSYVIKEWYDESRQRGRRRFHYGDYIFTFLEDYSNETDELWMYLQKATDIEEENVLFCSVEAYSNQTQRWFSAAGFFGKWLQESGSMDDAVYEGIVGDTDDNGIEEGDYNMRGLLADKWTKETSWNGTYYGTEFNIEFNVSYYWSIGSNWAYATYNTTDESPVPLRIETIGHHYSENATGFIEDYDFYHSYEYVAFFSGDDAFDDSELDFFYDMPDWIDECDTTHYCQHYPDADLCNDVRGPDLPILSDKFLVTVEINDKKNSTSYFMQEYYDYPGDRVHLVAYYDNTYDADSFHQLELDTHEQRWYWIGKDDDIQFCRMDMVEDNYTGIDLFVPEVNGHIASASAAFHFNTSRVDNKVWMGYTTVRNAIPAEKWKGIWNDEFAWLNRFYVVIEADSYYYFSRDTWSMSFSNFSSNIPIRFELDGRYLIYNITDGDDVKDHLWLNDTFDISGDMVGFSNGNLEDSYFSRPSNWREVCNISTDYCMDNRYKDLDVCYDGPDSLPVLPQQFETVVEAVFVSKNFSIITEEYYDEINNRARVIFYPFTYYSTMSDYSLTINYSSHFLEDGEIFWQWEQNNGLGVDLNHNSVKNCKLQLVKDIDDGPLSTFFNADKEHVQSTARLFDWVTNNSVETYIGTKNVRGILCDRWRHNIQSFETTFTGTDGNEYTYETNMTVVYSFMTEEYKSSEIYGDYGIPVRADVTGTTKMTSNNGYEIEYDYEHYYNYIKFIPRKPDDFWFEPPTNTSCNITQYCNEADSFNIQSSSSSESDDGIAGDSSEEYNELCDEISDSGTVFIEAENNNNDEECEQTTSMAAFWVVAVLVWLVFMVGCFFLGSYRERTKPINRVQLQDDPNNPNL